MSKPKESHSQPRTTTVGRWVIFILGFMALFLWLVQNVGSVFSVLASLFILISGLALLSRRRWALVGVLSLFILIVALGFWICSAVFLPYPWRMGLDVVLADNSRLGLRQRHRVHYEDRRFIWTSPDGQRRERVVQTEELSVHDTEVRLRDDKLAVYFVEYLRSYSDLNGFLVTAALDLAVGDLWVWDPPAPYAPPGWATLSGGRPLARMLQMGERPHYDVYVTWHLHGREDSLRTTVRWARSRTFGWKRSDFLLIESGDTAFYRGEWRYVATPLRQRDPHISRGKPVLPEKVWMIDSGLEGGPRVSAAIDFKQGLFYDERGIVWRIPRKPGSGAKVSDQSQPYPQWATVAGG